MEGKMEPKIFAEIHGEMWEVGFPLCEGCPEFMVSGRCRYKGNGCRFPKSRVKKPRTFRTGFLALLIEARVSPEKVREFEIKIEERLKERR